MSTSCILDKARNWGVVLILIVSTVFFTAVSGFGQDQSFIVFVEGTVDATEYEVFFVQHLSQDLVGKGATVWSITDVSALGQSDQWKFVSLVGLEEGEEAYWTVDDNGVWLGNAIVRTLNGLPVDAAVQGTEKYSVLLGQISESELSQKAKESLSMSEVRSAAVQSIEGVLPWTPGTEMLVGEAGLHAGGFRSLAYAFDFNTQLNVDKNQAPNMIRAATAGAINWVCPGSDGDMTIQIGNTFVYGHLQASSDLSVGRYFNTGDSIAGMVGGEIGNLSSPCGHTFQRPITYHLHFAFPSNTSITLDGWTIDTSTAGFKKVVGDETLTVTTLEYIRSGYGVDCPLSLASNPAVAFFSSKYCVGQSEQYSFSSPTDHYLGSLNNAAESFYLKPGSGASVTFYANGLFSSPAACTTSSIGNLKHYFYPGTQIEIGDSVTSFSIDLNGNCSVSAPVREIICGYGGGLGGAVLQSDDCATQGPTPTPTAHNPTPTPTHNPNDNTPPSASGFEVTISGGVAYLSVSGVTDNVGVSQVRYSAKWDGRWDGIAVSTAYPYSAQWNMCSFGVSDQDIEFGMEVWDYSENKWIWSQHFPNPHRTKSYNCNAPTATPSCFKPGNVQLQLPRDNYEVMTDQYKVEVQFAWSSASNANWYQFQVASDPNFNNLLFDYHTERTSATERIVSNDSYWRVRAQVKLTCDFHGDWSAARKISFVHPTPTITLTPTQIPTPTTDPVTLLPDPPTNVRLGFTSSSSFRIEWDDSPNELKYRVYQKQNGSWHSVAQRPQDTTHYYERGLDCNFSAEYGVAAVNDYGITAPVSVQVSTKACGADELALLSPDNNTNYVEGEEISFEWAPGAIAVEYLLILTPGQDAGIQKAIYTTKTQLSVADLVPGTYEWIIIAFDENDFSYDNSVTRIVTIEEAPIQVPDWPPNVRTSDATENSIRLSWDDVENEDGYVLWQWQNDAYAEILRVGDGITSFVILNLACGTEYHFAVSAYNSAGESEQNGAPGTTGECQPESTTAPTSPTGFWQSALTKTSFTLKWEDNSSNEDGFRLYTWDPATDWTLSETVPANTTTHTVHTTCEGGSYYKVVAFNEIGESRGSNYVNAHSGPCSNDQGACPSIEVNTVTFYEHWKCLGVATSYTVGSHASLGDLDNTFSGVKIPYGMSTRIYDRVNFTGPSRCLNSSLHDFFYTFQLFDDGRSSLSDATSSLKVFNDRTCGGSIELEEIRIFLPIVVR